jgi:hypothetical protein
MCSRAAARPKCNSSATATNPARCLSSTAPSLVSENPEDYRGTHLNEVLD